MENICQIITQNSVQKIVKCKAKCEYIKCERDGWCNFLAICKYCKWIMCSDCIRTDFNGCLNCMKRECYICKIDNRCLSQYHICQKCNNIFCETCTKNKEISQNNTTICFYVYYCGNCWYKS